VVLDSTARLPLDARLVATAAEAPVLVATGALAPAERLEALRAHGCEVVRLAGEGGRPSVAALLDELGRRRLTNILIEGGSAVLGSFLETPCALDEVHVFIAPRLIGGAAAKPAIGGPGAMVLAEGLALKGWRVQTVADNLLVEGWV
jgi:diaminohydroxyphosphoribosylaminopyrimidine deaminase/5-amino-6-(5-phosphoribosylamino)uracil reductase